MILIVDIPGQLCNQLWAYCNMIAIAKECNACITFILPRPYYDMLNVKHLKSDRHVMMYPADSFLAKRMKWLAGFVRYRTKAKGLISLLIKKMPISVIDDFLNEQKFKTSYKRYHLYFFNSWEQRLNKVFFLKHRLAIQSLVLPVENTFTEVNRHMKALKTENELIIGVHIRRGDYEQFMGGRYFFSDDVYVSYMKQLENIFHPYKLLFYFFSNEPINPDHFKDFKIYYKNHQSSVWDLWAMSQCHYLIGPVSTFSMWASFWKQVPLCFIDKTKIQLSLQHFKPVIAQDVFKGDI